MDTNKIDIPEDIEALLSEEFFQELRKNLPSIKLSEAEEALYYPVGSAGFSHGVRVTCEKLGIEHRIYEFYETLSWEEADEFDLFLVKILGKIESGEELE